MDIITFFLLLLFAFLISTNLLAIYWYGSMLIPIATGGAPFVPSRPKDIERMIEMAQITSHDVVVDLGSGDGRIVLAAAKAGAKQSIGYEIHPSLVRTSRKKITRRKLHNAEIRSTSMWKADLSGVNVVLLYQVPYAMKRLEVKLLHSLPDGARVVSNAFEFPNWRLDEQSGSIRRYKIKK